MQAVAAAAAAVVAADADADAAAAVEGAVASVAASADVQLGPCSDLQQHRKLCQRVKSRFPCLPKIQTTECIHDNGNKTDRDA